MIHAGEGERPEVARERGLDQRRICEGNARGDCLEVRAQNDAAGAIHHRGVAADAETGVDDQRREPRETELDREHEVTAGPHRDGNPRGSFARDVRGPDRGSDPRRGVEWNAAGEFVDVGLTQHFPIRERRFLRARGEVDGRRDLGALAGQERDGGRALDLPEHQAQRAEALLCAQLRELHGVGGQAGCVQARGHLRGDALGDETRRCNLRGPRPLLERTA